VAESAAPKPTESKARAEIQRTVDQRDRSINVPAKTSKHESSSTKWVVCRRLKGLADKFEVDAAI
jgi:hypothetical protein